MRTSLSTKNIAAALLQAQMEMGAAKKDSKNPFFKSNYADLGSVMEVCKGPLNANGIVVLQPSVFKDGKNFITTRFEHAPTGEWYEADSEVVMVKQNDPQSKLAAETYTRRGSLQAFGFIPAEDDDGNTAAGRTKAQAYTPLVHAHNSVVTLTPVTNASAFTEAEIASQDCAGPKVLEPLKTSSFKKKPKAQANGQLETANSATSTSEWS